MIVSIRPSKSKAVDRTLQTQADRLCSMVHEPVVLPALTQELIATQ